MGIDVKDLPPAYQAQALRKWAEQERRKKCPPLPSPVDAEPGKPAKYHNKPTERVTPAGAVLRFDSQKEARRYDELAALERAGEIRELRIQVDFTLQEAYTDSEGRRVRAIRYRADFVYWKRKNGAPAKAQHSGLCGESASSEISELSPRGGSEGYGAWEREVEDVKSRATRTKEYLMKRKLMKERFNIDIQEV
ncbi:DUF1064 domain-containing protein [Pseudoflavonifractor sp. 524-17]|uniref:DUF1064 domain-containing protein n=1 Tax=Pseudoflavonifractor sp. 524-17 TaxID=2304577 RepID=UPI0013798E11|nr:DUF1064 domain-containing protein [Pseudoflavonifractor sp. 524-17]NCE63051.1 DUF1064 domain-containing protein [Pseudoflavonifractor sp. 524-17]